MTETKKRPIIISGLGIDEDYWSRFIGEINSSNPFGDHLPTDLWKIYTTSTDIETGEKISMIDVAEIESVAKKASFDTLKRFYDSNPLLAKVLYSILDIIINRGENNDQKGH